MNLQDCINHLSFNLTLNELKLLNKRKYKSEVSYNSIMYIEIISYIEDCTISKLADLLGISKPAVTIKVNELEKQKLIKKVQSKEDKRIYYIQLCKSVEDLNRECESRFFYTVDILENKFSKEKLDIFCEVLEFFSETYTEHNRREKNESQKYI